MANPAFCNYMLQALQSLGVTIPGLADTDKGSVFVLSGIMCALACTLLCRRVFSTSYSNAVVLSVLHVLGYQELRLTPWLFALHLPLQVLQGFLTFPVIMGLMLETSDTWLRVNLTASLTLSLIQTLSFVWRVYEVRKGCTDLQITEMTWNRFFNFLVPLNQSLSLKATLMLFATQTTMIVLQGKALTEVTLLKIAGYNAFVLCSAASIGCLWHFTVIYCSGSCNALHHLAKAALWLVPSSALTVLAYTTALEVLTLFRKELWLLPWFNQPTFVMSLRFREMVQQILEENPYGVDFLDRVDILFNLYKFGFPKEAFFWDVFMTQLLFAALGAVTSRWVSAGKNRNILFLLSSFLFSNAGTDVGTHLLNHDGVVQLYSLLDHRLGIVAAICWVGVFVIYGQPLMDRILHGNRSMTWEDGRNISIGLSVPVILVAIYAT